ncbi:MAG: TolB-like translocation protein [Eubacteriales bacterium]
MARLIASLAILLLAAGCTVGGEKDLFKMAKINQNEIVRLEVKHDGKTVTVDDAEDLPRILRYINESAPVTGVTPSRIVAGASSDYTINLFTATGKTPARFVYDSEKQLIFYGSGKKKYPPYKNETLAAPLARLFDIDSFRAVIAEKPGLPDYFEIAGWFSKNKFYGMRGEQFTIWDMESGNAEVFLNEAWTSVLSPDRTKAAYNNKQGLFILNFKTLASTRAVAINQSTASGVNGPAVPVIWSRDSQKLLYAIEHEWSADFYIYDIPTGSVSPFKFKNIDNFLSSPVAWLKNGDILFMVGSARSRDGKSDYRESGYRSNLMRANPEGVFTPLTETEDSNYVEFAGLTENDSEALIIIRDKNNEHRQAAAVNLTDGVLEVLSCDSPVSSASISPDGRFIVLTCPGPGLKGYRMEIRDRKTSLQFFSYENKDYAPDKKFIWHSDSRKLLYLDKNAENTPPAKLRQVLIIPK